MNILTMSFTLKRTNLCLKKRPLLYENAKQRLYESYLRLIQDSQNKITMIVVSNKHTPNYHDTLFFNIYHEHQIQGDSYIDIETFTANQDYGWMS